MAQSEAAPRFLLAGELAQMLHVSPKTIARYSTAGFRAPDGTMKKLPSIRTLGGHRRYDPAVIAKLIAGLDHSDTMDGGQ